MGDDLEQKRQRLIAEYEHLVQRKEYERQMQLGRRFCLLKRPHDTRKFRTVTH